MAVEEYTSTTTIRLTGSPSEARRSQLRATLAAVRGVEAAELTSDGVSVSYLPAVVSPDVIRADVKKAGFDSVELPRAKRTKRKGFIARWVDRMAESNQKAFGGQRLDCCSMNNQKKPAGPAA